MASCFLHCKYHFDSVECIKHCLCFSCTADHSLYPCAKIFCRPTGSCRFASTNPIDRASHLWCEWFVDGHSQLTSKVYVARACPKYVLDWDDLWFAFSCAFNGRIRTRLGRRAWCSVAFGGANPWF